MFFFLFSDSIDFNDHRIIEPRIIHARRKRAIDNTLEKVSVLTSLTYKLLFIFTSHTLSRVKRKKFIWTYRMYAFYLDIFFPLNVR